MGLFDFLSSDPNKKVERLAKKILNEHHQQQVRQEALDELVSIGSPAAIGALIKRLGVNFRDTIKNEQEKRWISDTLVEHFPSDALEPLLTYVKSEQSISAPIMVLARILPTERMASVLTESLAQYSPTDHRTIAARTQLIDALYDYDDESVLLAVLPYLMDHDDDIRIKVMGIIEERVKTKKHSDYIEVQEGLLKALTDPMASGRITRRAAVILSGYDADLSKRSGELADIMPEGYVLGTNGRIREA